MNFVVSNYELICIILLLGITTSQGIRINKLEKLISK